MVKGASQSGMRMKVYGPCQLGCLIPQTKQPYIYKTQNKTPPVIQNILLSHLKLFVL